MSLDGFVAGPNQTRDEPLGEGGEQLHEWALGLAVFRESHGREGGERNVDDEVMRESLEDVGAVLMGRRMFGGGEGPWGSDPAFGEDWEGWWGDRPPFGVPVFVLTHHAREPVEKEGGTTFTFVTDGIEAALERARAAAGDRDVSIGGGAEIVRQYLAAGLVDEFQVHVAPVLLGDGTRLFGHPGGRQVGLECTRVVESPTGVTHLKYRVVR